MLCRAAVTICLLLTLDAVALAQSAPPDKPPSITEPTTPMDTPLPGDHWSYEVRDEITGELKFISTTLITDVTPTEVAIRAQSPSFSGVGVYIYDHSWNLKNSPIWRFSPNDGTGVKLPLNVGSTWKFQDDSLYGPRGITFKNVGSSRVVAQESITTSAGTFDTFKIETSINGHNVNDPTKRFASIMTTWYAPSIDHWVKRISKSSFNGRVDDNSSAELVEYGRR